MSARFITVRTGARLHFGPLSYRPERGRHFGGVGLMIDRPGVHAVVGLAKPGTSGSSNSARVRALLDTLKRSGVCGSSHFDVDVLEEIPPHSGLGSGTQLALAVTDAILTLQGHKHPPQSLALISGRGDRSAIGLFGYEQGGFLIDAGRANNQDVGALATRVSFPAEWRVLLVRPIDGQGLHGSVEMSAFQSLPSMSEQLTGRLCRLALTELLPALQQNDFAAFTSALYEYGQLAGEFFAPSQGGVFASTAIRRLAASLSGPATGMAQSSWGPTVALFAEGNGPARDLWQQIKSHPDGANLHVEQVQARNRGRELTSSV
ncbi:GHMP family kinase ATP-binding protein [Planctomicrobium piriforme]|uniref:Beta-RFAP synthase n=1 Tax=Planctomicrobium piriforme TaxID=1576369 RepID=A0A1I3ST69_9PLAN|nr:hypothetical protein [Planctomicrobium piriforme]SFJ61019.1 beta-RFAP synthase [Planctomicrobium piriforme]